jgi:hypothetical protein
MRQLRKSAECLTHFHVARNTAQQGAVTRNVRCRWVSPTSRRSPRSRPTVPGPATSAAFDADDRRRVDVLVAGQELGADARTRAAKLAPQVLDHHDVDVGEAGAEGALVGWQAQSIEMVAGVKPVAPGSL